MSYSFYKEKEFVNTPKGAYPKAWKIDKFDSFMTLEYGKGLSQSIRREGPYPVFGSNGIVGYHDEKLVKSPGIIVGRKGTIGAVTRSRKDFWPIDTTFYIKLKTDEIDWNWLYYELMHLNLPKLSSADVVPGLKRELVNNLTFPLPSFEEQKKIAEVLGVVDSAIELSDQVIAKTERLKRGLMQQLLTRGIGHTETKQTPIGNIPKEWEPVKLGDALEQCQYGLSVKFGEEGKYPILKMDDIVNGVAVPDKVKRVDLETHTFCDFKLEKGDVLFNRTNSYEHVGRTGIFLLDGDYTFASYLIRLKPKKDLIDSQFLTFYLIYSSDRLKQLATRAVHRANINATNLQSFPIVLPPLKEQKKIAQIILTLDQKLGLENKEKARLEQIKKGLMDLLLTGKVRIKVD